MTEELRVRFDREMTAFVRGKKEAGQYRSAQDYIRYLVRQDMQNEQNQSSLWLRNQLRSGLLAADNEFLLVDATAILAEARRRGNGS